MSAVRDTARVTPLRAVPNTVPKKRRATRGKAKAKTTGTVTVDKRVMEAARAARRAGEQIKVVSSTEVWLVPRR